MSKATIFNKKNLLEQLIENFRRTVKEIFVENNILEDSIEFPKKLDVKYCMSNQLFYTENLGEYMVQSSAFFSVQTIDAEKIRNLINRFLIVEKTINSLLSGLANPSSPVGENEYRVQINEQYSKEYVSNFTSVSQYISQNQIRSIQLKMLAQKISYAKMVWNLLIVEFTKVHFKDIELLSITNSELITLSQNFKNTLGFVEKNRDAILVKNVDTTLAFLKDQKMDVSFNSEEMIPLLEIVCKRFIYLNQWLSLSNDKYSVSYISPFFKDTEVLYSFTSFLLGDHPAFEQKKLLLKTFTEFFQTGPNNVRIANYIINRFVKHNNAFSSFFDHNLQTELLFVSVCLNILVLKYDIQNIISFPKLNQTSNFRAKTKECTEKYITEAANLEITKDHLRMGVGIKNVENEEFCIIQKIIDKINSNSQTILQALTFLNSPDLEGIKPIISKTQQTIALKICYNIYAIISYTTNLGLSEESILKLEAENHFDEKYFNFIVSMLQGFNIVINRSFLHLSNWQNGKDSDQNKKSGSQFLELNEKTNLFAEEKLVYIPPRSEYSLECMIEVLSKLESYFKEVQEKVVKKCHNIYEPWKANVTDGLLISNNSSEYEIKAPLSRAFPIHLLENLDKSKIAFIFSNLAAKNDSDNVISGKSILYLMENHESLFHDLSIALNKEDDFTKEFLLQCYNDLLFITYLTYLVKKEEIPLPFINTAIMVNESTTKLCSILPKFFACLNEKFLQIANTKEYESEVSFKDGNWYKELFNEKKQLNLKIFEKLFNNYKKYINNKIKLHEPFSESITFIEAFKPFGLRNLNELDCYVQLKKHGLEELKKSMAIFKKPKNFPENYANLSLLLKTNIKIIKSKFHYLGNIVLGLVKSNQSFSFVLMADDFIKITKEIEKVLNDPYVNEIFEKILPFYYTNLSFYEVILPHDLFMECSALLSDIRNLYVSFVSIVLPDILLQLTSCNMSPVSANDFNAIITQQIMQRYMGNSNLLDIKNHFSTMLPYIKTLEGNNSIELSIIDLEKHSDFLAFPRVIFKLVEYIWNLPYSSVEFGNAMKEIDKLTKENNRPESQEEQTKKKKDKKLNLKQIQKELKKKAVSPEDKEGEKAFKEALNAIEKAKEKANTTSQIKSTKDSGADECFKSQSEPVVQLVPDLRKNEGSRRQEIKTNPKTSPSQAVKSDNNNYSKHKPFFKEESNNKQGGRRNDRKDKNHYTMALNHTTSQIKSDQKPQVKKPESSINAAKQWPMLQKSLQNKAAVNEVEKKLPVTEIKKEMPQPPAAVTDTISQIKSTKDSGADECFKSEDERVYENVPDLRRDLQKNEVSFKSGNWYEIKKEVPQTPVAVTEIKQEVAKTPVAVTEIKKEVPQTPAATQASSSFVQMPSQNSNNNLAQNTFSANPYHNYSWAPYQQIQYNYQQYTPNSYMSYNQQPYYSYGYNQQILHNCPITSFENINDIPDSFKQVTELPVYAYPNPEPSMRWGVIIKAVRYLGTDPVKLNQSIYSPTPDSCMVQVENRYYYVERLLVSIPNLATIPVIKVSTAVNKPEAKHNEHQKETGK